MHLGLSQEELCDRSGLDRTYLSGIERGARSPTLRNLVRVAAALQVPLSQVVLTAESAIRKAGGRGPFSSPASRDR